MGLLWSRNAGSRAASRCSGSRQPASVLHRPVYPNIGSYPGARAMLATLAGSATPRLAAPARSPRMTIARTGSHPPPSAGQAKKRLFVTTALPYANGSFHIGHIMEYIQADIWVRFQRLLGHEVHFVGADDAHGAPIMLKAEAEGIAPEALVGADRRRTAALPAGLPHQLRSLAFDAFAGEHRAVPGDLPPPQGQGADHRRARSSSSSTRSRRCSCRTATSRANARSATPRTSTATPAKSAAASTRPPTSSSRIPPSPAPRRCCAPRSTTSSGFRIRAAASSSPSGPAATGLQPEVANKAREWLGGSDGGTRDDSTGGAEAAGAGGAAAPARRSSPTLAQLTDWDISRDAPYFGIPIPDAPGKFFYVWLDAPVGYLASLKAHCQRRGLDFESFIAPGDGLTADGLVREQVHFIGKDIIYFHTLFWPAMLRFADFKVPDHIFVHGFLTVSGEKMSKSRGTGLSPLKYLRAGHEPGMAALLPGRQAQQPGRGRRFQCRGFRRARQQRPDRQAGEHRQPLRRLPHQALRRRARRSPTRRPRRPSPPAGPASARSRTCTSSASSARRCARSCRSPIGSTNSSTARSPGTWPRSRTSRSGCTGSAPMPCARFGT